MAQATWTAVGHTQWHPCQPHESATATSGAQQREVGYPALQRHQQQVCSLPPLPLSPPPPQSRRRRQLQPPPPPQPPGHPRPPPRRPPPHCRHTCAAHWDSHLARRLGATPLTGRRAGPPMGRHPQPPACAPAAPYGRHGRPTQKEREGQAAGTALESPAPPQLCGPSPRAPGGKPLRPPSCRW